MTRVLSATAFSLVSMLLMAAAPTADPTSVASSNKEVARRVFTDIFNHGRYGVAAQIYAPEFKNHGLTRDAGLQEDQEAIRGWRAAAPDLVMTVDDEIAEGDKVVVLWHGVGTNTGSGNGYSATGKRMQVRGITVWRMRDKKITEEWSQFSAPYLAP